jgi:hypothetical protein
MGEAGAAAEQTTDGDQEDVEEFVVFGVIAARVAESAEGLLETVESWVVWHSDVKTNRH